MPSTDVIAAVRDRQAAIRAAIHHLRTADAAALAGQLANANLKPCYKTDPGSLADMLDQHLFVDDSMRFFGAWKGAQQVLYAAGLPDPSWPASPHNHPVDPKH